MKKRELTITEKAVLAEAENKTINEVARSFDIMPQSVKETLCRAYFKLNVASKADAIKKAKKLGLIPILSK